MRYYATKKKVLYCGLIVILFIILLHPSRYARGSYKYIKKEEIVNSLLYETAENFSSKAIVECDYFYVIYDDSTVPISIADDDLVEGHKIKDGGEYAPIECRSRFSTAIIVPYRDRAELLRSYLVYMHMFLRKQLIHYRIFVVEQVDSQPFNTAKLMNIGALAAIHAGFPCLVLHDVDLLPLRPSNLYACTKLPRHLSASINKFRFVLPQLNAFDGVISIAAKQFKDINGMSNKHFDFYNKDDLYTRLTAKGVEICRFEPSSSRYYMTSHNSYKKVNFGSHNLKTAILTDGLNSLKFTEVSTVLHPLFTHIMVDL